MSKVEVVDINAELKKQFPNTNSSLSVKTDSVGNDIILHIINGLAHYEFLKTNQGSGIYNAFSSNPVLKFDTTFEEDLKEVVKKLDLTKEYSSAILKLYKQLHKISTTVKE